MTDEFQWPERAVERLDKDDLKLIKKAGEDWVSRNFSDPLERTLERAFIAGAAWSMQYRWND